jgi:thiamine biosynthesis lipoprotein
LGGLAALLLALLAGCRPASAPPPPVERVPVEAKYTYDNIMGTYATLTFWDESARSQAAAEATMAVFREVNERFSNYLPESELSRLNASAYAAPVACSDELWELLRTARTLHRQSHGAFDISAGPLMKLWGFHRKRQTTPTPEEVAQVVARVGLDKVVFDDAARTVKFTVAGMELDSGGIAKGYALDLAAARLRELGVQRGLLDLGGNLLALPEPPPGRPAYRIGIRNPRARETHLGVVSLLGQAVSTSGDYERFVVIEGKRYSHLMDPRTGYPVEGMAAVSVIAPNGVLSDCLSTALLVNRGEHLAELQAAYPTLQALLIRADEQGHLTMTKVGDAWAEIAEANP